MRTRIHEKFEEMENFAKENGYLIAVYIKLKNGKFALLSDDNSIDSIVSHIELVSPFLEDDKGINYNDVDYAIGQLAFKLILHNNYNLPENL